MKNRSKQQYGQVLILLVAGLFLGSAGGISTLTTFVTSEDMKNTKKIVKKIVPDKKRKDTILKIIDNWESEHKYNQQQVESERSDLLEAMLEHAAMPEDIQPLFDRLNFLIAEDDAAYLNARFKLRAQLTKEEWQKIWQKQRQ